LVSHSITLCLDCHISRMQIGYESFAGLRSVIDVPDFL
jgi:hypothetical protein